MQSAVKDNYFFCMRALSERLFLSAVREACAREDGILYGVIFAAL